MSRKRYKGVAREVQLAERNSVEHTNEHKCEPWQDEDGVGVNQTMYRGLIGALLYLSVRRPDIVFNIGMCEVSRCT